MKFRCWLALLIGGILMGQNTDMIAPTQFESDIFPTESGDIRLTFIGHASLMIQYNENIIHIDPTMGEADYSKFPDADLILITHSHFDHLDGAAIDNIKNENTRLIYSADCEDRYPGGKLLANGEIIILDWITVEAVPAYNLVHKRPDGNPFHPKGSGNGYIISISDLRIYIAGDTENIPEMKVLENIDIAFLPMNLPYTMTPEMVRDAAIAFRPKILYPYHYGTTDPQKLVELLKKDDEIEVRIRQLQ